ncbi:MAG: GyrI-like domain-containing protein [Oscillospiraceae bacterium]
MNHKIIKMQELKLTGIMGDGSKTTELWNEFDEKANKANLSDKSDGVGYEVRFDYDNKCDCFVGFNTEGEVKGFKTLILPECEYVVFDVVVANGYDSENDNMTNWLDENKNCYIQSTLDRKHYIIEIFGKKFNAGIVEMCIPLKKV